MEQVVLVPNYTRSVAIQKKKAAEGNMTFGTTVSSLGAWVADLWQLYGDGRTIVSATERALLIKRVLKETGVLRDTPGTVRLVCRMVSQGSGHPAFDAAVRGAGDVELSLVETKLLRAAERYYEALDGFGLVEQGHAMQELLRECPQRFDIRLEGMAPLPPVSRAFVDGMAAGHVVERPALNRVSALKSGMQHAFLFPSGGYSQANLLADFLLETMRPGERALVAAADPEALFEACVPRFAEADVGVALRARKHASQTAVGRALLSLYDFKTAPLPSAASLTDFLLSPFSGFSSEAAYAFDKAMRKDRLAKREDCMAAVVKESEGARYFDEVLDNVDSGVLFGAIVESIEKRRSFDDGFRQEQVSALGGVRLLFDVACRFGMDVQDAMEVLELLTVDVSRATSETPSVVFARQSEAASLEPGAFDVVVATDLTTASYPVKSPGDAVRTLFAKLGIPEHDTALDRVRRDFAAVEQAASRVFACERVLNDESASPAYPCITLQEFIDCYREDPSRTDDVDKLFGLPEVLRDKVWVRGEGDLYRNAARTSGRQRMERAVDVPALGHVSESARSRIVLPRMERGTLIERPSMSPSQIESYLECPYKWFAHRRLRLESIDEEFGALAMGDFAHNVLHDFYVKFQESGRNKVQRSERQDALALIDACFDERYAMQPQIDVSGGRGRNRLVAITELEERQVEELRQKLRRYIVWEEGMLPTYTPTLFEHVVKADEAVDYAGVKVVGAVDRVDVDENGHAAIIDYKGSVTERYAPFDKDGNPSEGKVQALVYAQMLRRLRGLDVRAALYVSYGRRPMIRGAYDGTVVDTAALPGVPAKKCECGFGEGSKTAFVDLLDSTEERVAAALERMLAGDIEPNPLYPEVCDWCPVLSCPKRGGNHE